MLRALSVPPYKQYQEEALEAVVGQAIHLSYRLWPVFYVKRHGVLASVQFCSQFDLGKEPSSTLFE